ncbi:MAG: T9SS type A sorting domain-containing protein [Flavobacteriaceae bacterium]|nr:T9SS type A sorting domain-containing protein [Flavobacteriaceae bacterium]
MKNYLLSALAFTLFASAGVQAQNCAEPTNIQIQRTSVTHATINGTGSDLYDLYIKPAGDPAPTAATAPRPGFNDLAFPYTSNVLLGAFGYDLYVRSQCADGTSAWTGPYYIAPYVACEAPADVNVVRTGHETAEFTSADTEGIYDYYVVLEGGIAPAGNWTGPNHNGRNDVQWPHQRTDLVASFSYDVYFRKQCNVSQVSEWTGPFTIPLYEEPAPVCNAPEGVTLTRTSDTTATVDGADPAFTYQGTANRAGRALRPYPMYGMEAMTMPHTQENLVAAFDYDVWFRTDCGDGLFSEWAGPFYLPVYEEIVTCDPNEIHFNVVRTGPREVRITSTDTEGIYDFRAGSHGAPFSSASIHIDNISLPFVQEGLNEFRTYDYWVRKSCPAGGTSEWMGPYTINLHEDITESAKVSPNPTHGLVKFEGFDAVSAQVMNYTGRTMTTLNVVNGEINISNLTPGNYVINAVDAKGNVKSFKVVKK